MYNFQHSRLPFKSLNVSCLEFIITRKNANRKIKPNPDILGKLDTQAGHVWEKWMYNQPNRVFGENTESKSLIDLH